MSQDDHATPREEERRPRPRTSLILPLLVVLLLVLWLLTLGNPDSSEPDPAADDDLMTPSNPVTATQLTDNETNLPSVP